MRHRWRRQLRPGVPENAVGRRVASRSARRSRAAATAQDRCGNCRWTANQSQAVWTEREFRPVDSRPVLSPAVSGRIRTPEYRVPPSRSRPGRRVCANQPNAWRPSPPCRMPAAAAYVSVDASNTSGESSRADDRPDRRSGNSAPSRRYSSRSTRSLRPGARSSLWRRARSNPGRPPCPPPIRR